MSKKKTVFKFKTVEWVGTKPRTVWTAIKSTNTICGCCGAHLESVTQWEKTYYKNPSGKGIVLRSGHEEQKLTLPTERQYNLNTVNGPISFIIRHNKEPNNGG